MDIHFGWSVPHVITYQTMFTGEKCVWKMLQPQPMYIETGKQVLLSSVGLTQK